MYVCMYIHTYVHYAQYTYPHTVRYIRTYSMHPYQPLHVCTLLHTYVRVYIQYKDRLPKEHQGVTISDL